MATDTAGAPAAVAASPMLTRRPGRAVTRAPSAGVGAVQVAPGRAAGRAPDQGWADAKAGSARLSTAATTTQARKLDRMDCGDLDISGDCGDLGPPAVSEW